MPRKHSGRLSWIKYFPEDLLTGVALLEPLEELAYRRILDYIVVTKNNLPNDDAKLVRLTKTGRHWRAIKTQLLVLGKIQIDGEFIRNERMTRILKEAAEFSEKQRRRALGHGDDEPNQ